MNRKTRKHIWPVALMSLAVFGVLAVVVALSVIQPQAALADGCDEITDSIARAQCDARHRDAGLESTDATHSHTGTGTGTDDTPPAAGTMLKSSSTSGGASIMLTLTIKAADMEGLVAGDRIEIYLEDDYSVPDSISTSDVYFRVPRGLVGQNNGGRVNAADVSIDDDDHFTPDKDDLAIAILVPDMDPRDDEFGYPVASRDLVVVIEKDAGITNPTEEGEHSNGYSILTGSEPDNDGPEVTLAVLNTWAKISLSASDGGRGKEVTVTGSGFNNDTGAEVFVFVAPAVDDAATPPITAPTCATVVSDGESLGTDSVDGDDAFTVIFTVHQDEFDAGKVNYICAEDSEAGAPRQAMAVKVFDMTASVSIDPTSAASGEEVTLKARDFGGPLDSISLGADDTWTNDSDNTNDDFAVKEIDGDDYIFDLPGGLSKSIQIAVKRGSTRKTTTLSVTPSSLTLSSTEVVPNETIIVSGKGFSEDKKIMVSDIKIDGKALVVDDAGTEGTGTGRYLETTSNGEFTVTVMVWHDGAGNPALDDDEYTIKVTDETGFEGKAKVTIKEPTVSVNPTDSQPAGLHHHQW